MLHHNVYENICKHNINSYMHVTWQATQIEIIYVFGQSTQILADFLAAIAVLYMKMSVQYTYTLFC